ncbi:hypothetical protein SCHPADRAFT_984297 [Schizopora paradoxa]|uniref:Aminoglycoside phosphotransferase domain-containing protein n=1 Tax=Schizopora paradoxa TaxID=27342 RepID=A0A0H2RCS6_9AGAM|nr:hypothetical protein SCHPADRAFT_984297 [Schizopora paradoxa]
MLLVTRPRIPIRCQWLRNLHRHKVPGRVIPGTSAIQSHSFSQLQTFYPDDHEFFRYTSGRWLRNEEHERSIRYMRFDVNELCKIASNSCGAEKCVGMKKVDESGYNRVFLLHFDNGREAVARIPFPNLGPPHLLTASEVATLDFVRNAMSIPAPKVLAWNSRAESTPVGTEFIILEREDLVGYPHTTKIFADESMENEMTRKFAIGPHMSAVLWREERDRIDVDRGPWNTSSEYVTGLVRYQQGWLQHFPKPRRLDDPTYRSAVDNDPKNHIEVLEQCLKVMPHLTPINYSWPAIWHPDLRGENIFVTKDAPHTISGIINWKFAGIGPFFLQMKVPEAFDYNGSRVELPAWDDDTGKVKLPDDFESLPDSEKKLVKKEQFEACVHRVFKDATKKHNPSMHALLFHRDFSLMTGMFRCALDSWSWGLAELHMYLLVLSENWENIAVDDGDCPLRYSDEENMRIFSEFRRGHVYHRSGSILCERIGCDDYGRVRDEDYDTARALIKQLKPGWIPEDRGGPYLFETEHES